MARRTRTSPSTLPTLTDALAWLRANDAKALATYCAADGTVTAWRKRYARRKDGTIVGFHDGAQGAWESYSRDVREYVAHKMVKAAERAALKASMDAERAQLDKVQRELLRSAIAAVRKHRADMARDLSLVPEAHRALCADLAAKREGELVAQVRTLWQWR